MKIGKRRATGKRVFPVDRTTYLSILPPTDAAVTPGKALGHKPISDAYALPCNNSIAHNMSNAVNELPDWGEMPTRAGLYLSLSHGRDFPQQAVRQRGFPGPKIGPLLYMQTHYAQRIVLRFASRRDATKFFPEASSAVGELDVIEGTLVYDNKCYGDWDICYIAREFCRTTA